MVNKQPEALQLADDLEVTNGLFVKNRAAAVLRRLYELNSRLTDKGNREVIRNARLEETNKELLEALRNLADLYDTDEGCRSLPEYIAARAAIAKATGETK